MAQQLGYIQLDGKKYIAMASLYKLSYERQRTIDQGLTGLSIIQDFTRIDPSSEEVRMPQLWDYRVKVYIDEVDPARSGFGNMADLLATYAKLTFTHIDVLGTSWTVAWAGPLQPLPIVPANMDGHCYGQNFVALRLERVFQPAA